MSRRRSKPLPTYVPTPYMLSARAAIPRTAGCYDCDDFHAYSYQMNDKNPRERAAAHRAETGHATWVECDPAPEFAADEWRRKINPRAGGVIRSGAMAIAIALLVVACTPDACLQRQLDHQPLCLSDIEDRQ